MPRTPYPNLESELASAIILDQRTKQGISTGQHIGQAEEKAARDKARNILKVIDLNIMNRKLTPQATAAERDLEIQPYRHATKIIDLEKLTMALDQTARSVYVLDTARKGQPHADKVYRQTKRNIDRIAAFDRER